MPTGETFAGEKRSGFARPSLGLAVLSLMALLASGLACNKEPPAEESGVARAGSEVKRSEVKLSESDRDQLREEMRQIARDEARRAVEERRLAPHERGRRLAPGGVVVRPTGEAARPIGRVTEPAPAEPGEAAAGKTEPALTEPAPAGTEEPASPSVDDASLTVIDLQTALNIDRKERQPVGAGASFSAGSGAVWAYAVIKNDSDTKRRVSFVWKRAGKEIHRAELDVGAKAAHWRTWSKKSLPKNATGRWTVEIVDESGLPIASRSFEVTP